MGWDAPWHWAVVAILAIALFGYKRLPDASRSLGRSLRIFKTELKGMSEDDNARNSAREVAAPTEQATTAQATTAQAPVELSKPAEQVPATGEPPAAKG